MPKPITEQIKIACDIIHQGGVVAYPTESCFGLGCHPKNYAAVKRIFMLKNRNSSKGLILIGNNIGQLTDYFDTLPEDLLQKMSLSWPSRTTWLVPAAPWLPNWIKGKSNKIAVRVPAHRVARLLCKHSGHALVSTSANLSGQRSARTADQVEKIFGSRLDYVLDYNCGREKRASTIVDLLSDRVIR